MPFDPRSEADLSTGPLTSIERRRCRALIRKDDRSAWFWAHITGFLLRALAIPSAIVAAWKVLELFHIIPS